MTDYMDRVAEMLKALNQKGSSPGGVTALVQLLSRLDRQSERQILEGLKHQNPKLADEIREQYFTFEDMLTLDDKVMKRALGEISRNTLSLALKGTTDAIQSKVLRNLSQRAARMLKEDMDLMGPQPKSLVEAAQQEVTAALRRWKNVIL
jgi:flagellar motor switch protein FliG